MAKRIFVTGTGTDVGKTYISSLILKGLVEEGKNCAYYKAALSGADNIESSDAGFVRNVANLTQEKSAMISYLYKTPLSPHLAAKLEDNLFSIEKSVEDYQKLCNTYDYIVVEGSGGIVCPIRWDDQEHVMQEDLIKKFDISVIVVCNLKLGSINSTVLTIEYLKNKKIKIEGIVVNNYEKSLMEDDNMNMIREITKIPIIGIVKKNDKKSLHILKSCSSI